MKHSRLILKALLACCLGGLLAYVSMDHLTSGGQITGERVVNVSQMSSMPRPLFTSDALAVSCIAQSDQYVLTLFRTERVPGNTNPEEYIESDTEIQHSVSYRLSCVTARHAQEIYVAGLTRSGDAVVIERWTFPTQPGGYYTVRPVSTVPLGESAQPSALSLEVATPPNNGSFEQPESLTWALPWRQPSERAPYSPEPPIREELYRGADLEEIHSMAVDPEGRFLLLTARNSPKIYRLTLAEEPTPSLLYDDTDLAGLKSASTIDVRQHAAHGRIFRAISWTTQVGTQNTFILLKDATNDGIVDNETVLTEAQYQSSEYPGNWTEDFVFYAFASAE